MAFPTSPTDGQIYNGYKYDASVGCWNKTNFIVNDLHEHGGDQGDGFSLKFLNNTSLQFGKTATSSSWPYTQAYYNGISPFPVCLTEGPRSNYYTKAGASNNAPTTTSFEIQWRAELTGENVSASSNAHWLVIGGE